MGGSCIDSYCMALGWDTDRVLYAEIFTRWEHICMDLIWIFSRRIVIQLSTGTSMFLHSVFVIAKRYHGFIALCAV
jgi:hypothetical protein